MGSFTVNRDHQQSGRKWHSGPSEQDQVSIPGVSSSDEQRVDLNHATEGELSAVDALDAVSAHALVAHRVHHGHFESWADVAKVPGITPEQIASLQRGARIGGLF